MRVEARNRGSSLIPRVTASPARLMPSKIWRGVRPSRRNASIETRTTATTTVPAAPGVTGKGNYKPGILTTPISVYFRAQERIIYDQVIYAIKLFEAEKGYKPRSHEEFMKDVIEFNQLKLPKLPEGHTYKYDPEKGELMVEQPG